MLLSVNNYLIQSNLTFIRVRDELNIIKRGAPFTQGIGVHRNLVETIKEVVLERKDYFFEQMSERGLTPDDGSKCMLIRMELDGAASGRSTTGAYSKKGERVTSQLMVSATGDKGMVHLGRGRTGVGVWAGQDKNSLLVFQLAPHKMSLDELNQGTPILDLSKPEDETEENIYVQVVLNVDMCACDGLLGIPGSGGNNPSPHNPLPKWLLAAGFMNGVFFIYQPEW